LANYQSLDFSAREQARRLLPFGTLTHQMDGSPSENRLLQSRIQQDAANHPARDILRQMYKQVGSTDCWRLLSEPDSNQF